MTESEKARRTHLEVLFDGIDISSSMEVYLLSMTYTDNEEDEADDLQIKLQDRDDLWLRQWLGAAVASDVSSPAPAASNDVGAWAIGDSVTATGRPQYSSYGEGKPGAAVAGHQGKVTYLNLKNSAPYPIHVDQLGWFALSQVQKGGAANDGNDAKKHGRLKIRAWIVRKNWNGDGKEDRLFCGAFELDSVDVSGPPGTVTLKASSLPYSSRIRQTKKSKAWESYKLSGIAKEMASANGLSCLYESKRDPQYDRVEQNKKSDISFLSGLCHDAGVSLKVTDNTLVLFDQAAYEAKEPSFTIERGKDYKTYKLTTGEADTQYASCRVSYTDPGGKLIEAVAYVEDYDAEAKNNQCLEISAKVSNIAEARELAEKRLRLHNKHAKTASFTLPGHPLYVAGVTLMLSGWGFWDGKYMISKAKHTVTSAGGYTAQIQIRSVLEGY